MKKLLELLRKLGILKAGVTKGTYTSAKDRPDEFSNDSTASPDDD